jgi:hypothetical protein
MRSDDAENSVLDVARTVSNETRLSFKQATALLMREILDRKDKEIADILEVAPTSTSSYVSVCREKFDAVDEEIAELEEKIVEWEKTEQFEDILDRFEFGYGGTTIEEFNSAIQSELVDDEEVTYLIAYVDEQGEEKVQSVNTHPRNIEDNIEDKEVLQYKRISSVEEVFE